MMDFFKISILTFVSYIILNKKYHSIFDPIKYLLIKNSIYTWSTCKFYVKKYNPFKYNICKITFIKDGLDIFTINIDSEAENNYLQHLNNLDCDFILYIDNNNWVRYDTIDDLLNEDFKYNSKSIKFLKEYLHYKDHKYNLDLKTNNFFIENNKLFDIKFLKYFCKNQLNFEFDETIDYTINILDHNCENIEINNNNYIILNKEDYTIHKIKTEDPTEDPTEKNTENIIENIIENTEEECINVCPDIEPIPNPDSGWRLLKIFV